MKCCDYCHEDFSKELWIKNETYKGIDVHHNPPLYMMKNNWKGEIYNLCRKHHRELHDIQIRMLNEIAGMLKFCKSEYWVWVKMTQAQKDKAIKEIYEFTKKWVENGNQNL